MEDIKVWTIQESVLCNKDSFASVRSVVLGTYEDALERASGVLSDFIISNNAIGRKLVTTSGLPSLMMSDLDDPDFSYGIMIDGFSISEVLPNKKD